MSKKRSHLSPKKPNKKQHTPQPGGTDKRPHSSPAKPNKKQHTTPPANQQHTTPPTNQRKRPGSKPKRCQANPGKQPKIGSMPKRKHGTPAGSGSNSKKPKSMKQKEACLRVACKNWAGHGSTAYALSQRQAFFTECMDKKVDIILIQETHCESLEAFKAYVPKWKHMFHSGVSSQSAGIAILINPKCKIKHESIQLDEVIIEGRAMAIKLEWEGLPFIIANFYLTSGSNGHATRTSEINKIIEDGLKKKWPASHVIAAGDWNCIENQVDVKRIPKPKKESYSMQNKDDLESMRNKLRLVDWYHESYSPEGHDDNNFEYTHCTENATNHLFTRIDRVYVSEKACPLVKNIETVPKRNESDHDGLLLTLGKPIPQPKKAQWYLNNNHLKNPSFVKDHLEFLNSQKEKFKQMTSPKDCEKMKNKIIANLKQLEREHQHIADSSIKAKESTLKNYKLYHESGNLKGILVQEREKLKNEITQHYKRNKEKKELSLAAVRKLFHDRASRPYFALEKSMRLGNDRIITSLKSKVNPDVEKFCTKEILEEVAQPFYSKLYSKKDTLMSSQEKALESIKVKISQNSKSHLDKEFDTGEIRRAIKSLGLGKAPGLDGLSIDYYHKFTDLMSIFLESMYRICLNNRTLPKSSRTSIISVLHKKKEKNIIENYRPISLTCNDYKIFSKMLQLRLNEVINEIIGTDQNGFVPNRFIGENNMLLHEIIQHMQQLIDDEEDGSDEAYLLFLDFEKAFDRVDHDFMFTCLEEFGIGNKFVSMVKLLYSGAQSKVRINNEDSEPFPLLSGVRQGCPISPLLFAMVVETMSNLIRDHPDIEGVLVPDVGDTNLEVRLSQHADDTVLIFRNFAKSFPHMKDCIKIFCEASGMKINVDKTEGLMLGTRGQSLDPQEFNLKWDDQTDIAWVPADKYLRSLGTQLTNAADLTAFWDELVEKMVSRLNNWNTFWPNIISKILISKLSLLSCIWYFTQNMEVPGKIKGKLQQAVTHFVWSSKTGKLDFDHLNKGQIGLDQTVQSTSNKGLKMLHVESETAAFAARWLTRLLSPSVPHWKKFVMHNIRIATSYPLEIILHSQIPAFVQKSIISAVSPVWKLAFTTWFNNRPTLQIPVGSLHLEELKNMPIFSNDLITVQGSMLQKQPTHKKLWWVKQLYSEDMHLKMAAEIIHLTDYKSLAALQKFLHRFKSTSFHSMLTNRQNVDVRTPYFYVPATGVGPIAYVQTKNNLHKCKIDPITWQAKIISPPIKNFDCTNFKIHNGYKSGKRLHMSNSLSEFNHSIYGWELHCEMINEYTPAPEVGYVQSMNVTVKQWYWIQIPKLKPKKDSKWNRGGLYWSRLSGMVQLDYGAVFKQIRSKNYSNKTRTIMWRVLRLAFYHGGQCKHIPNMHSLCQCCPTKCLVCDEILDPKLDGFCELCGEGHEAIFGFPAEVDYNTPIHIFHSCPFLKPFWAHIESLCEKLSIIVPQLDSLKVWFFITGYNVTHPRQPYKQLWINIHSTYIRLIWNHYYSPVKHVKVLIKSFENFLRMELLTSHIVLKRCCKELNSKVIVNQANEKELIELKTQFESTWCHPSMCTLEEDLKLNITHNFKQDNEDY